MRRYAWYRRFRGVYHFDGGDYVRLGRAACGRDISHASYTLCDVRPITRDDADQLHARLCKACLRKQEVTR